MLRIMTYNIRACLGVDGTRSVERIAKIIQAEQPDIVALQEVDLGRPRSERIDQALVLAQRLEMQFLDGPVFTPRAGGTYGNAVLSRFPIRLVRNRHLPRLRITEPRSVMWVRFAHHGEIFDLLNTHLSFLRADRPSQITRLLGPEWLADVRLGPRVILCGDLNCSAADRHFRRLALVLKDAQADGDRTPAPTWPTHRPSRRLDHIMVSPDIKVEDVRVVRSSAAAIASDHFPLIAEVRV